MGAFNWIFAAKSLHGGACQRDSSASAVDVAAPSAKGATTAMVSQGLAHAMQQHLSCWQDYLYLFYNFALLYAACVNPVPRTVKSLSSQKGTSIVVS